MNEDNLHSYIEPELEARIVALILGEASDFEREELERLISQSPELAFFKKRIETVHDLLHDVAKGEPDQNDADWKLPSKSRDKILATIDGTPAKISKAVAAASPAKSSAKPRRLRWTKVVQLAAAACLVVGVSASALLFSVNRLVESPGFAEADFAAAAPSSAAQASAGSRDEFDRQSNLHRGYASTSESKTNTRTSPEYNFVAPKSREPANSLARSSGRQIDAAGVTFESREEFGATADTEAVRKAAADSVDRPQSSLDAIRDNLSSFAVLASADDPFGDSTDDLQLLRPEPTTDHFGWGEQVQGVPAKPKPAAGSTRFTRQAPSAESVPQIAMAALEDEPATTAEDGVSYQREFAGAAFGTLARDSNNLGNKRKAPLAQPDSAGIIDSKAATDAGTNAGANDRARGLAWGDTSDSQSGGAPAPASAVPGNREAIELSARERQWGTEPVPVLGDLPATGALFSMVTGPDHTPQPDAVATTPEPVADAPSPKGGPSHALPPAAPAPIDLSLSGLAGGGTGGGAIAPSKAEQANSLALFKKAKSAPQSQSSTNLGRGRGGATGLEIAASTPPLPGQTQKSERLSRKGSGRPALSDGIAPPSTASEDGAAAAADYIVTMEDAADPFATPDSGATLAYQGNATKENAKSLNDSAPDPISFDGFVNYGNTPTNIAGVAGVTVIEAKPGAIGESMGMDSLHEGDELGEGIAPAPQKIIAGKKIADVRRESVTRGQSDLGLDMVNGIPSHIANDDAILASRTDNLAQQIDQLDVMDNYGIRVDVDADADADAETSREIRVIKLRQVQESLQTKLFDAEQRDKASTMEGEIAEADQGLDEIVPGQEITRLSAALTEAKVAQGGQQEREIGRRLAEITELETTLSDDTASLAKDLERSDTTIAAVTTESVRNAEHSLNLLKTQVNVELNASIIPELVAKHDAPSETPNIGQSRAKFIADNQDKWFSSDTAGKAQYEDDAYDHTRSNFAEKVSEGWESESLPVRLRVAPPAGLDEKNAATEAFSTFSLHVSDVSFKLAQAALNKGEWPDADRIRIEEFVNAFDYGDPMPNQKDKVACNIEQAIHPFLQQRNLVRIAMRTAAAGRSGDTPLRLTLLLDNSGSMERVDRQETVRRAFALLTSQLQPNDQVTLISFARQPRLLADQVSGANGNELNNTVANIPSEGGTNLEAALNLAFEKAQEQQSESAQNRIILLTDGAANLGDAKPGNLAKKIESIRDAGIAFDAAGIGADGLNDEILEALTRKGDGRYYLLDRPEDADAGFAKQIAGALRPAAKNVKIQVEFNPQRVGNYKLLGFEKHLLNKEDFRDDTVDAAEMAAEEAGVAVYQVEPKADGQGDIGSVSVRFRDMSSGEMVERRWPIPFDPGATRPDQAAPSQRVSAAAALFAAKLKGDPLGDVVELEELSLILAALPERFATMNRVQQLQQMIHQARQLER